ncbi:MAG: VWA domain-containing protein [Hyphomicrobium sp.]|nr:VWA domain-containing protein [Hyphomicrobium sp.]
MQLFAIPPALALMTIWVASTILAVSPASADTPTIVVIDGSGSMWGKMPGNETAKFYATRDHLRVLLGQAAPQSRTGLVSFGHRRKGDCQDVEVIAPPEAGGAARLVEALDQLNPKGKGPLAEALKAAAGSVGTGAQGTIILIHDGLDNCQQDACATAGQIAKSNPRLKINILSLGLEKADSARMRCVAEQTGGRQIEARTEAEIGSALTEFLKPSTLDPAVAAQPAEAVVTPPPTQASGPPGLRLTAAFNDGGTMIGGPIGWVIRRVPIDPAAAPLVERTSAEINEPLDPGTYQVSASLGLVTRTVEFEVGSAGPKTERVALDAGTLKIAMTASRDGAPLKAPVVSVIPLSADGRRDTPIWIGREGVAELVVPSGSYEVDVVDGLARAAAKVALPAGGTERADIVLETGELTLAAVGTEGGVPLDNLTFVLEVDDPEAPLGRREIARSAAPRPTFTVVAGTYYVTALLGPNIVRDRVAVSIGDRVQRTLVLGTARVRLNAELIGVPVPPDVPIAYRITEMQGQKRVVARSSAGKPAFTLAAGSYKVEAQLGTSNVKTSRLLDVASGKDVTVDLVLEAKEVRVGELEGVQTGPDTRAVIRDQRGRTVWRSRRGDDLVTLLSPGRYVVSVESQDERHEQTIEVLSQAPKGGGAAPGGSEPASGLEKPARGKK